MKHDPQRRGVWRGWRLLLGAVLLVLSAPGAAVASAADDIELVDDLVPGPEGSFPIEFTELDGILYFAAGENYFWEDEPPERDSELWRSDGTADGTFEVVDLNPAGSSYPHGLATLGDKLFFTAKGGIWRTDGTAEGTVHVSDFGAERFTRSGDLLFFRRGDSLWRTDGTEGGTYEVVDTGGGFLNSLTDVNGTLFFMGNDGEHGFELWRSDGTAAGTFQVVDINPGPGNGFVGEIGDVNGTAIFSADDGSHGVELWRSDGTETGTSLLKDINPAGASGPRQFTEAGGELFFSATDRLDSDDNTELWRTDGTSAGTVQVKDIRPGAGGSDPHWLTEAGGELFFQARPTATSTSLWRSDGTDAGTIKLADLRGQQFTDVDGTLFLSTGDGVWRSDGTTQGTFDLGVDLSDTNLHDLGVAGGTLFLSAYTSADGIELWRGVDHPGPLTMIASSSIDEPGIAEDRPTFAFRSDDPLATFQCRLYLAADAPPAFSACSGPGPSHTPSTELADGGPYVFEVAATNTAAETDPTPARRRFQVDTVVADPAVDAPAVQHQRPRRIGIRLTASAAEIGGAEARGRIEFGQKTVRLREAREPIDGEGAAEFLLRPLKSVREDAVLRALDHGRRVRAFLSVTLSDLRGNSVEMSRVVRLRR